MASTSIARKVRRKRTKVDPGLVTRLLTIHQTGPDRAVGPMDTGLLILRGVAATLNSMGAPMLESDDDDEQAHGEALYFLTQSINRGIAFIHGAS